MNTDIQANDELTLDDLFDQVVPELANQEADLINPAPAKDQEDELDLEALLVENEPTTVSENAAIEEVIAKSNEDDLLSELFDENELGPESLVLNESADVDESPAPEAKVEKKEKPKAKAADKGEKKEKSPSTARTTYQNAKRSAVLLDRLGGDTSEIVLEFSDVDLTPEELKAKQTAFLNALNMQPHMSTDGVSVQKKVAEKVVILFTMFKRNGSWNEVMYRTFKVLLTDGFIQSGDGGNLVKELLAKPYSVGTARAQAGQMMQMLPLLKIAKETGKGRLEINENSTIVARLRSQYFADLSEKPAA